MGMSDRILCILEVNQISRAEFARRLQITQAYVSKLINKGAEPSSRLIEDICEKFRVSETWFRTGEGEMGGKQMPLLKTPDYTIHDVYALPEGKRAELINGQMYLMAPPNRMHQEIVGELFARIREYIRTNHGFCKPYFAPFAVFLNADDRTYVEPDISVICDGSKLTEKGCSGAPDWVIEIVSPSSRHMDYITKTTLYSEAGVREYWIVDQARSSVTVYSYEKDAAPTIYLFEHTIPCGIFDDLKICIRDLLQ